MSIRYRSTNGRKRKKYYIGEIRTARQLIRHRNIMLGLPIPRSKFGTIPYGYEDDPDREAWLRPIQKELDALYFARNLRARSTIKQLAAWISKETGREITWQTLRILFRYRPPIAALLLPLHDRLSIATAPSEETATALQPINVEWNTKKSIEHRTSYHRARKEALRRKTEANKAKSSK